MRPRSPIGALSAHVLLALAAALTAACGGVDLDKAYVEAEALAQSGRVVAARAHVRQALDRKQVDPLDARGWRLRLLEAEVLVELGQAPAARQALAEPLPAPLTGGELEARREKVLGQTAARLRDRAEADRRYQSAARLARAATAPALPIEITYRQATLLAEQGRYPEAEARSRAVIDMETAAPEGARWRAAALITLGFLALKRERWVEALTFLEPALADARRLGAEALTARALLNAGICHYRLGDFERSRRLLEEAAAIQQRLPLHASLPDTLGSLGNSYYLAGDWQQAAAHFERALALARQHEPRAAARWASNLASAHVALESWEAASRFNGEAGQLWRQDGRADQLHYVALNDAAIARGRGDLARAERLFLHLLAQVADRKGIRWVARAELAGIYAAQGRHAEAERAFGQALADIEEARADLGGVEHRLTFLHRLIGLHRAHVEWLIQRGRIDEALAAVELARARVLSERLGKPDRPARPGAAEPRLRSRRRGEVFISYWVGPERSYAWVVDPRGAHLHHLPPERELTRAVEAYRTFIEQSLRDPRTLARSPAQALYDLVVRPLAAQVPPGSKVVIAADGPLHAVPFGALVVPGDPPRFWIEEVSLLLAPSLTAIAGHSGDQDSGAQASARPAGAPSLLAIGDPEASGPEFPRLPHAGRELAALRQHFGAAAVTTLAGSQARPEAYRESDPHRFSIVHFAAHAVANPASPLDSTIVLSRGVSGHRLSVRDVLRVPLAADLVTVSACRGAGARAYSGEGLVGFAWGFLSAGARQVVAGLWDVADPSTAALMDHMYAEIARGADPAVALRTAQLGLLRSTGPWRTPYHWAAFQAYLGPGATGEPRLRSSL